ncbi:MAG: hypothetical protein M3O70_13430, partial [Actinomycetota bacterium]|nr:hypothetical protein [Actinomycetota bacterium]
MDDRRFRRLPVTRQHVRNYGQVLRAVEIGPQGEHGKPFNCRSEEDDAFWTWAVIEVLRLTGIRIEELFELTHLSIRRYRQADGQLVLLLQIAPSKIDQERVIPISPELSHVLARIVNRVKGENSQIPLLRRYDPHERTLSPALPYLFQRQRAGGRVAPSQRGVQ